MTTDTIFREAGEIFARLFDHRAFLQGEQNHFVTEFEAKRKGRELINLQQTSSKLDNTIEKFSALNIDEVDNHLAKVTANMSTALEMSRLILDRDKDPEKDKWLKEQRANRMHQWTEFVDDMCIKVAVVDKEFTAEVDNLAKHYTRLEDKLRLHAAESEIQFPSQAAAQFPLEPSYQLSAPEHASVPYQLSSQALEQASTQDARKQTPSLSQAPEQINSTKSRALEQNLIHSQAPELTHAQSQAPEQTSAEPQTSELISAEPQAHEQASAAQLHATEQTLQVNDVVTT